MTYVGVWSRRPEATGTLERQLLEGLGSSSHVLHGTGPGGALVVVAQPGALIAERNESFALLDGDHHSRADGESPPDLRELLDRTMAGGHDALADVDATAGWTLFDSQAGKVTIARDAVGNGSMFMANLGNAIVWSPRLGLLQAAVGASEPDWRAFDFFVANGFVPSPWTMFRAIERLGPGELIDIDEHGPRRIRYHDFVPEPVSAERRFEILQDELPRSIANRVEDVERTGVLLSGGVDSQLVTAMITEQMGAPPIGFTFQYMSYDGPINEGERARRCTEFLGAKHVLVQTDPLGLAERLASFVEATGEPLARTIHTVVLDVVHEHGVDVLLTGDGADSLYLKGGDRKTLAMAGLPGPLRSAAGGGAALGRTAANGIGLKGDNPVVNLLDGVARASQRAGIGMNTSLEPEFIKLSDRADCYVNRDLAHSGEAARIDLIRGEVDRLGDRGLPEKLRALELRFDGADDLLRRDLDIAQINNVSIRSPFFSTNVMTPWMTQPVPMQAALKPTKAEFTKLEVRRLASTLLPDRLANAPKLGHSIPVVEWLRGPLLPWLKEITSPAELQRHGVFDPVGVSRLVDRHVHESERVGWGLWSIASATVWLDHIQRPNPAWLRGVAE